MAAVRKPNLFKSPIVPFNHVHGTKNTEPIDTLTHDNVSKEAYLYRLTPFSMNVNLKISKRLYRDRLNIAIFVNRLFTYSPSYRNETNALVRRYSSPYFGMELNFKL